MIRLAVIFVLTSLTCLAQDSVRVRSAVEELERVRQLVSVGAAPANQLAMAEEKLQEAKEAQSLDRLLFSQIKIEELTESQTKEMVQAAGDFAERENRRLEEAVKMVENGLRPKHSLEPFVNRSLFGSKPFYPRFNNIMFGQLAGRIRKKI